MFNACYERVLRYAQRRTDEHTAHDVAAETLLLAWRRLPDVPDDPLPWLLASARLMLANRRRTDARHARTLEKLRHQRAGLAVSEPENSYDENAWWRWALSRLPLADQELLTLLAWDGLTHAEAALVLGCRPSTFAMRLGRARRRLLKAVGAEAPHAITARTKSESLEECT